MRGNLVVSVMLVCLMASGCSSQEASDPDVGSISPEATVQQAATHAFAVPDSAVSTEYRTNPQTGRGNWNIVVTLESFDTTAAVDQAAAGVLTAVASVDTSDTPVSVSALAYEFRFPDSDYEWGALHYWWADLDDPSYPRGTDIALSHVEAQRPGEDTSAGITRAEIRGHWQDVDMSALERWSQEGAPDPVLIDTAP